MINIQPMGRILSRSDLISLVYDGYGSNPDFRIEVKDCLVRYFSADAKTVLATYVEYQSGSLQTTPSENVRFSTVLFELPEGDARPIWLHIHETGLPG